MDSIIAIFVPLIIFGCLVKTERPYLILWSFATPIFYLIFGFKSIFVNLGFTKVELFSGFLPVIVALVCFNRLTKKERSRAWKYSPKLWWAFLAYYTISLIWSENFATGIRTAIQVAFPSFLFIIAFNLIQGDYHLQKYFKWMMIINVVIAVFDIYLVITGWDYIKYMGAMNEGTIGYRTVSAYFYLTMALLLLVQLMEKFNLMQMVLFLIDVSLLLLAASRTPAATFLFGCAVAVLYRRKLGFTLMGVFIAGFAIWLMLLLPSKNKFFSGDAVNTKDSGREYFQKFFRDKAEEKPIFGFGAGGSEVYAGWITRNITPVGAPHNEYLRVRYDAGYFGLALFILGLAEMIFRGLYYGRWLGKYFPLKVVLLITPAMFALSCTQDNTFFYFYVFTQYLFTFMGFAGRVAYEERLALGLETIQLDRDDLEVVFKDTPEHIPATTPGHDV